MPKNNAFNNFKVIDYKDTEMLKKFLDQHSKMISRQRSGASSPQQRKLAIAIKRARFMALLPYISR